jgi:hypothetical protein
MGPIVAVGSSDGCLSPTHLSRLEREATAARAHPAGFGDAAVELVPQGLSCRLVPEAAGSVSNGPYL